MHLPPLPPFQIDLRGVALGIKHAARAMKKNAPAGRQGPAVEGRGRAVGICLGAAPDEGAALRLPGGAVPQNASADDMATG